MINKLKELVLPYVVGIAVHSREVLTDHESMAQRGFLNSLKMSKSGSYADKPVMVALVGLAASGKSMVAHQLARQIGAVVITGDAIRVELRKVGAPFERARAIGENIAYEAFKRGLNVVIDSDHIDQWKRASIRRKAKLFGARLFFVRVVCDYEVLTSRVRQNESGEFFAGAVSSSHALDKGKDVKLREVWRRTPHHYRWQNSGGGVWIHRQLPFEVFAEINTTHPNEWRTEVERIASHLRLFCTA